MALSDIHKGLLLRFRPRLTCKTQAGSIEFDWAKPDDQFYTDVRRSTSASFRIKPRAIAGHCRRTNSHAGTLWCVRNPKRDARDDRAERCSGAAGLRKLHERDQQAAARVEQRTTAAQAGAKAAREKIMTFAERNIAASFEVAQRLARAKDLQEMAQIQQEFLRSQMQTLSEQAKELVQGAAPSAKSGGGKKAR
jgi:Phasin protein